MERYRVFQSAGNAAKDEHRQPVVQSLGERIDGVVGVREPIDGYPERLVELTIWMLGRSAPRLDHLRILLGRW
eukprot:3715395-Lingulodinium_polyedra.AAC.1